MTGRSTQFRWYRGSFFALSFYRLGAFLLTPYPPCYDEGGFEQMKQISGNKLLVKALREEGVEYVFGYPGACTIDISDELYKQDDITVILPRHEQALVHAADA